MWVATSPIVAQAFGDVFYGARTRRNLEPATVAERGRIGLEELSDIEQGQVEPSLTLLMRSGLGLGVSPVWLFEEVLFWLNPTEANAAADDLTSRRRMRAVGYAFTSVRLASSEQELSSAIALGERLINEFAKHGLVIVSIDESHG